MSQVIHTEQELATTSQTVRHVLHESAKVSVSYNGHCLTDHSTYINWGIAHCTALAVEAAVGWCERYQVDRRSRLVVSVLYQMEVFKQVRRQCSQDKWRYDPLQDPDWQTEFGSKKLEECVVWRSDENFDWALYEQRQAQAAIEATTNNEQP